METGEQEPIAMDAETQEELMVPSSGAATDEPMIPTDLEHQVETTEVTVTQETVNPVTEEEEPVGPPSIETRTVETQKGELCNDRHEGSGSVGKVGGDRTGSD